MRTFRTRRLALWGLATSFAFLPGLAPAQDGQREVGPPVTTPKTNQNRQTPSTFVPPRVGSEVLTPVPATATDPAPPGTRVERVDAPAANPGATTAPAATLNAPGMAANVALPAGVQAAEGVIVDRIRPAGKDLPDEQIRITVDPTRTWSDFASPGSAPAAEPTRGDARGRGDRLDLVVTRRSALFTYARTPDGRVVPDPANPNAPDNSRSRSGLTPRGGAATPLVAPTNFTVLKPGQFVAVHYRRAGRVNEVVSLALIVVPTVPATGGNAPPITRPTGVAPATGTTVPSTGATPPATGRVPRVPTTPVGPAALPQ